MLLDRRAEGAVALLCATVAALAAAVAAIGPAHHDRTTVEARVAPGAYVPVLVAAHRPASLVVDVPCAAARRDTEPVEVLGSSRDPAVVERLGVRAGRGAVTAQSGDAVVTTVAVTAPGPDPSCVVRLEIVAHDLGTATWSWRRGDELLASVDAAPPVVAGFAAGAAAPADLRVSLTTFEASSHPSARQWVAIVMAVLAGLAAFALVARRAGPAPPRRRGPPLGVVDAVVVAVTLVWWLAGPSFYDDGWLMATVRARAGSGSFSNYFDTYGTQMPLGFGHHVLLWSFALLDAPFLWWRTVPVLATLLTWWLVRGVHERWAGARADLVALAAAHLTFVCAWTMTLRPEPVVALLAAVVLVATLRHRDTGRGDALVVAVCAAAVAVSLHPSGAVAAAPLVLAVVPVGRALRRGGSARSDVVVAALLAATAFALLLFADTDLARWRADRGAFAGDGFHSKGFFDELDRYRDLLGNGTFPQVASVLVTGFATALLLVAVVRRRGRAGGARDAAVVMVAGVALLALTPSKWTYHFGSLAAFAALAVAGQATLVLRRPGRILALLALVPVAARALHDPKDAQYFLRLGTALPPVLGARLLWFALAAVAAVLAWRHPSVQRRAVAGVLAVVVVAALGAEAIGPAVDGPAWATPRAALADMWRGGCPYAADVDVSDLATARPLAPAGDDPAVYLLGAGAVDPAGDLVVVVHGEQGARDGSLRVSFADATGAPLASGARTFAVPPFDPSIYGPPPATRPIRISRGADRPTGAARVAVRLEGDRLAVAAVVATAPPVALRDLLVGRTALVSPPELPLLRCTRPPLLHAGVAAVPDVVIGFERRGGIDDIPELDSTTGPWAQADDVAPVSVLQGWLTDSDAFPVRVLGR